MQIIKSFSIFKGQEPKNDKMPTHRMSAKVGESYVDLGSLWTKTSSKGTKFLSGQLQKAWLDHTDNTKSRKSIVMVFEEDLIALHKKAGEDYVDDSQIPPTKPQNAPDNDF